MIKRLGGPGAREYTPAELTLAVLKIRHCVEPYPNLHLRVYRDPLGLRVFVLLYHNKKCLPARLIPMSQSESLTPITQSEAHKRRVRAQS